MANTEFKLHYMLFPPSGYIPPPCIQSPEKSLFTIHIHLSLTYLLPLSTPCPVQFLRSVLKVVAVDWMHLFFADDDFKEYRNRVCSEFNAYEFIFLFLSLSLSLGLDVDYLRTYLYAYSTLVSLSTV